MAVCEAKISRLTTTLTSTHHIQPLVNSSLWSADPDPTDGLSELSQVNFIFKAPNHSRRCLQTLCIQSTVSNLQQCPHKQALGDSGEGKHPYNLLLRTQH